MKKTLSIILCILMLFGLFLMPVAADGNEKAILADDFSAITYAGVNYLRYDTAMLSGDYWSDTEALEVTTAKEHPEIKKIYVEGSRDSIQLWAEITYKNGSILSASYLREDLIPLYDQLLTASDIKVEINFEWPENNRLPADYQKLIAEPAVTLKETDLYDCSYYEVCAKAENDSLIVSRGHLIIFGRKYYYVDFAENEIYQTYIYPADFAPLKAHPITDEAFLKEIRKAENAYEGISASFSESFSQIVGICVVILFFALLPLGLAILGSILLVRGKKTTYKKLGLGLMIASIATLLIVVALALMILL